MNEDPRPGGCIAQQMVAMPEMYEVSPERVVDHLRLAPIDPCNRSPRGGGCGTVTRRFCARLWPSQVTRAAGA